MLEWLIKTFISVSPYCYTDEISGDCPPGTGHPSTISPPPPSSSSCTEVTSQWKLLCKERELHLLNVGCTCKIKYINSNYITTTCMFLNHPNVFMHHGHSSLDNESKGLYTVEVVCILFPLKYFHLPSLH